MRIRLERIDKYLPWESIQMLDYIATSVHLCSFYRDKLNGPILILTDRFRLLLTLTSLLQLFTIHYSYHNPYTRYPYMLVDSTNPKESNLFLCLIVSEQTQKELHVFHYIQEYYYLISQPAAAWREEIPTLCT